jgi:cation:H+ antiporter
LAADSLPLAIGLFVVGVAAIWLGGSRLPETGKSLADRTGVSATALGLFILSVVTSLPELAVTLWAMLGENAPDLAIGNILGSNNFNLTCLVGLQVFYGGVLLHGVGRARFLRTSIVLVARTVLVGIGVLAGHLPGPPALSVLLVGLPIVGVFAYDAVSHGNLMRRDGPITPPSPRPFSSRAASGPAVASAPPEPSLVRRFLLLSGAVVVGGFLTARGANGIALHPFMRAGGTLVLGQTFVGTLLVAVATSMPEVSVGYSALRRAGSADMALGTLMGSNIVNILVFAAGTPLLLLRFSRSAWSVVSEVHLVSVAAAILLTLLVMVGIAARRWRRGVLITRLATFLLLPVYLLCLALVYRWT